MKKVFKKIFKTFVACVIILLVATFVSLFLNIIQYFCPTLYWIIGIVVLLVAGYLFGNVFR